MKNSSKRFTQPKSMSPTTRVSRSAGGSSRSTSASIRPLARSVGLLKQATAWIAANGRRNPDEVGACSYDYLRMMALTSMAWMWAWSAKVANANLDGDNSGYYHNKLITGRFFMQRLLPQVSSLLESMSAGADTVMAMDAEAF